MQNHPLLVNQNYNNQFPQRQASRPVAPNSLQFYNQRKSSIPSSLGYAPQQQSLNHMQAPSKGLLLNNTNLFIDDSGDMHLGGLLNQSGFTMGAGEAIMFDDQSKNLCISHQGSLAGARSGNNFK